MKLILTVLFFSFLFIGSACKKSDSELQLPDTSSSGKNFLACKVSGVLRLSSGLDDWNSRTGVNYSRSADKIVVSGDNDVLRDDLGISVKLPPDSVRSNVSYELGGETNENLAEYFVFKGGGGLGTLKYKTISRSGWIRFSRVDTAIAAGTFAFTAYRDGLKGGDSVVITDGRFDISWK